jgi:hypothetical protein
MSASKRLRVSSQSSAAATCLSSQDAESKGTAAATEITDLVSARRDAAALATLRGALDKIPELTANGKKQIE